MLSAEDIAAVLLGQRLALTAYIASVTRDFHLAEDVFQEICVKALGRAGEFATPQHALNWARLAGRNRAVDVLRARDGRYEGLSEELLTILATEWPSHEASEASEGALEHCLGELTHNNRELVRLRYFERRSGAEVARLMGRRLETVYQALARVHKALGKCVRRRMKEATS